MKSPRYRWPKPGEFDESDGTFTAEVKKPETVKKRRVRTVSEEFELRTWRLPEKYRKRYSPRGLDLSDSAIAKMTKGCAYPAELVEREVL